MRFVSKTLTVVLLAAIAAPSLVAAAVLPAPKQHERPAGCHEHGKKMPAPEPASYRCCQAGHRSALLQQSFALQPLLVHGSLATAFAQPPAAVAKFTSFAVELSLSGGPPITIPWRI